MFSKLTVEFRHCLLVAGIFYKYRKQTVTDARFLFQMINVIKNYANPRGIFKLITIFLLLRF